jgi:patatin-like phospholipase/acyl hydrolase
MVHDWKFPNLSTDAGGTRGVSQLKILAELMHRLNFEVEEDEVLLPCDVFDMIGGSGSGG